MTRETNIAQQIADALNNDGQQFKTRPTDDSEPLTFRDLVDQHGGASIDWRDGWQTGDVRRYTFADDSVITVAGDAWDIGFTGCFCWEGCPDDECRNHGDEEALARGLERLANWRVVDDIIEYYDDATNAWYCCDDADVIALGNATGPDVYSHWCAQTSHQQVEDRDALA